MILIRGGWGPALAVCRFNIFADYDVERVLNSEAKSLDNVFTLCVIAYDIWTWYRQQLPNAIAVHRTHMPLLGTFFQHRCCVDVAWVCSSSCVRRDPVSLGQGSLDQVRKTSQGHCDSMIFACQLHFDSIRDKSVLTAIVPRFA